MAFPSLVLSFRLPRLAGIWDCGALVPLGWPGLGFPWLPGCGGCLAGWLPLGFSWRGFGCLAYPVKICVSTYCEKRGCSAIFSAQLGITLTLTYIQMTTLDLQIAEASAFVAKQAAFRAYSAAVGTEAEQAASEAYHSAFLAYARALDAWMGARNGGAL